MRASSVGPMPCTEVRMGRPWRRNTSKNSTGAEVGNAGQVAFDVSREDQDAGGRELLDWALQRHGLAGAGH